MNVVDKLTNSSEQNKSIIDTLNEMIDGESPETKSMKNGVENQSNFQCLLELIFASILMDFWRKIEAKLTLKMDPRKRQHKYHEEQKYASPLAPIGSWGM